VASKIALLFYHPRAGDEHVSEFSEETVAVCSAPFKRLDDLSADDDLDGMVQGRVAFTVVDGESNKQEYVYVCSCSAFL
jgi:hypothetical protein